MDAELFPGMADPFPRFHAAGGVDITSARLRRPALLAWSVLVASAPAGRFYAYYHQGGVIFKADFKNI